MSKSKSKLKSRPKQNHRAGSRKEQVHQVYIAKGADAARSIGLRKKLKESTLRTWFSTWNRPAPRGSRSAGAEARA